MKKLHEYSQHLCRVGLILLAGAGILPAQTPPAPFEIRVQDSNSNTTVVAPSNTITFAADAVGRRVPLRFTYTYVGGTEAMVSDINLVGVQNFSMTAPAELPVRLRRGESLSIEVTYTAAVSGRTSGQLTLTYQEQGAPPAGGTSGTITLNLAGVAPEVQVAYILPSDANVVPLAPGGRIRFTPVLANNTSVTTVLIANRGSTPATVSSVELTGANFQLAGLPLLPATIEPGAELRFGIRFQPRQSGTFNGSLTLRIGNNTSSFTLEATASSSALIYEVLRDGAPVPIEPNGILNVPETNVGEVTSLTLRVRNAGDGDGQVLSVAVQGQGFTLTDLPSFPLTLTPGSVASMTLNFAPTQAGRVAGRLRIGNETFELVAVASGSRLTYTYRAGESTNTVAPGGLVLFTPTPLGNTSAVTVLLQNVGTRPANITTISIVEPRTPFRITELPSLPLQIQPEGTAAFTVTLTPTETGTATATLRIDNQTFTLSGAVSNPPPLPGYRFTIPGGTTEPLRQLVVGLTLDEPYPIAIAGSLTIGFNSDTFAIDPALQFSTGGRIVNFNIPAGSTRAIFANGSTDVRLQTGTVAGSVTLSATFATTAGLTLNQTSQPNFSLNIEKSSPVLLTAQITGVTPTSFSLIVTGYATGRELTDMDLEFTLMPEAAAGLQSSRVNVPLGALTDLWFRSVASQAFGSVFTVTAPFTLSNVQGTLESPVSILQSVTVRTRNPSGTSNTISASFR